MGYPVVFEEWGVVSAQGESDVRDAATSDE